MGEGLRSATRSLFTGVEQRKSETNVRHSRHTCARLQESVPQRIDVLLLMHAQTIMSQVLKKLHKLLREGMCAPCERALVDWFRVARWQGRPGIRGAQATRTNLGNIEMYAFAERDGKRNMRLQDVEGHLKSVTLPRDEQPSNN